MKIFDIECYADKTERERLSTIDIESFAKDGAYVILSIGENENDALFAAREGNGIIFLKGETSSDAERLCRENPDLVFIAGGFFSKGYGEGYSVRTAIELLNAVPNVYLNLSGMFSWLNYALHEVVKAVPTDRLLFGSAFPFANPAYKRATVIWEVRDMSEEDRNKIMYLNAARLFGEV